MNLPKLAEIKKVVTLAQTNAKREWRQSGGDPFLPNGRCYLLTRGIFISVEVRANGKVENFYPGQTYEWSGSLKDIRDAIDSALKGGGELVSWGLFGGFDAAVGRNMIEARRERNDANYEPDVAQWGIEFDPQGIYKIEGSEV